MRFMLIALITFLTLSAAFNFDPGPAPGVKIKNGLLYLMMLGLMLRMTLDRSYRIQLPAIQVTFAVLVAYALLTYAAIVLVLDYPHYDILRNGFNLKNALIDQMVFFLVFFYGLRSQEDAIFVLKFLLACWALSHVVAALDAFGVVHIGDIEQRGDGRVQGAIGESNQYGAFVALTLPATAALILATRGSWRLFWLACTIMTGMTLIMTVSRGAFVATFVATVAGLFLFRRYVSTGKLLGVTAVCIIGGVGVVALVMSLGFGELLYHRLLGDATTGADLEGVSSGRTEIWAKAVLVMLDKPITLLTGYGWGAYASMPFRYATHNHYLAHWFNLGLPGLLGTILLMVLPIRTARAAARIADPSVRPLLMGFVVGTIAIATAVFFVDLYLPWLYYWAYAGIMMRIAVNVVTERASQRVTVPVAVPRLARPGRDAHGWTAVS